MIDKQVHADDFKLRLLLTNYCNLSCEYCLNDFQPKLLPQQNLDVSIAEHLIMGYVEFCKANEIQSEVYLSGGEPTLHPYFLRILKFSLELADKVVLCTNGKIREDIRTHITKWRLYDEYKFFIHLSIHNNGRPVDIEWVKLVKAQCSFVFDQNNSDWILRKLGNMCVVDSQYPFDIKIFDNFLDHNQEAYLEFTKKVQNMFPLMTFITRHTGIQENRGTGCDGCKKNCCTLKALWMRADNTFSPCPQANSWKEIKELASISLNEIITGLIELKNTIEKTHTFHKRR